MGKAAAEARIATQLNLKENQVRQVLNLHSGGATIPFMARYRKEATGGLDEVQIERVLSGHESFQKLEKRREFILKAILDQGKLTEELREKLESAEDLVVLEDLYLPYKPKRLTRAEKARQLGLEGLAKMLMKQSPLDVGQVAQRFVKGGVSDTDAALQGARDIMAEWISENVWVRRQVRFAFERHTVITSKVVKGKSEEAEKFQNYFDWSEPLKKCPSHRFLAMLRGEEEGYLKLTLRPESGPVLERLGERYVKGAGAVSDQVAQALKDGYKRLLEPSFSNEFRALHKERSDEEAIKVFTNNLSQLLLQPPVGQKRVLAIDPGYRTGCKLVCLDALGELQYNETIYPHAPQKQWTQSLKKLASLVERYKIEAIAIGNGTAGRETERLVKQIKFPHKVNVYVVDESGASIYSASAVGREEFPQYDVTVRGAVSIGRRLMDPLAELVKIDPKSIGVGQYQHDVDQGRLREALDRVVERVVNSVGVDLNTASPYLLQHVSGLGSQLAKNIVEYRKENGAFTGREALKKVPRLGAAAFEQCAGFLRVRDAKNRLDNSAVHPESYAVVDAFARDLNCSVEALVGDEKLVERIDPARYVSEEVGMPTLLDILDELKKPGRDPRQYVGVLEYDTSVKGIEDLKPGMELPGLVTNVTNFGAFVDVGIKENGLVHISELKEGFVSNPADVVSVYQKVRVRVLSVDLDRKRIQLSMKGLS